MTKLPRPRIDLALAATRMALPSFAATALVLSIGFAIAGYAAWALSSVIIAAAWLAAGCYGRWEGWIDLGLGAAVVLTIVGVRYGVGGIWGTIAVGLFAEKAVNASGADGLFFGGAQLWPQVVMAVAAPLYAVIMTIIIYKIVDALMCVRVKEREENIGLDLTQQSEAAYTVIE